MSFGYFQTVDRFSPYARALRREFDTKFKDPLAGHAARFVWDYWHVPGEYTVLRTPAYHYFSSDLYARFHRALVEWGRVTLGCHDVSPPWLSSYVEGCRQEQHVDRPHGPLAFVFSLTDWSKRKFRGGETFLDLGRRRPTLIEPQFNRLTLFNPSIPHGVREVRGTHDPRFSRLVIHGWFVNPRPFWIGPLTVKEIRKGLDEGLSNALQSDFELGQGLLSVRLNIDVNGRVKSPRLLLNTLRGSNRRDVEELLKQLCKIRFAKKMSRTSLTLPLICE